MKLTLKEWNRITDIPLLILSVAFLFAYSWAILAETHLELCNWVIDAVWVIYAIDYVVEFSLAENKKVWFKRNLLLLLSIALPIFRPLRLLQLVALLQMFNHGAGAAVRGRISLYAASMIVLLLYVGALAEYAAEHNAPGARITTFPTAVWWAFVTVTTVGYGDIYPVTNLGRAIAIVLMLTGIALIGIVTGMIASWIIDQVNRESVAESAIDIANSDAESKLLQGQMLQLSDSVNELNNQIARLQKDTKKKKKRRGGFSAKGSAEEIMEQSTIHPPLTSVHESTVTPAVSPAVRIPRRYYPTQAHYTSPRRKVPRNKKLM